MMVIIGNKLIFIMVVVSWSTKVCCLRRYPKEKMLQLKEEVRAMFQHAYDGYLSYASDYDELRPLTCDGIDTWGSYSLTLIDALDTLATMGNFTEFRRVVTLLEHKMNFDKDINVSVFETNIRIVGGLIGAHLMSKRAGVDVEEGWPCTGPLLRLAEDVARRLLPAFDTATGMPYGTVNLRYGVPLGETSVTCTAGVGTFLIEFGALSRLTGDPVFEQVALNAVYSLWEHRSAIGLFGNHIDVQTGRWTAQDAGIGAGVDSFYEYLVKAAILLNRPNLLEMFHEARAAIDKYLKRDDWYVWAGMYKGQLTLPIFQSLEAYWPGVLSMIGDFKNAIRTISKYNSVWKQYGFLPEFYNIPAGEATANRESYPLRPELAESAMYLYRATKNKFLLEVGENMVRSIECNAKTPCGYATIRNVLTHEKDNRMESFFLAETTKYLYLLFDEDNFLHNIGENGEVLKTSNGTCVIHAGAYIFNTEAHPVDMSALLCCQARHGDIHKDIKVDLFAKGEREDTERSANTNIENLECSLSVGSENNAKPMGMNDDDITENKNNAPYQNSTDNSEDLTELTVYDLNTFFSFKRENFASTEDVLSYIVQFMKRFTLNSAQIEELPVFEKSTFDHLGSVEKDYKDQSKTLWQLFEMTKRFEANIKLMVSLDVLSVEHGASVKSLEDILLALDKLPESEETSLNDIEQKVFAARMDYMNAFVNTTAMQEFLMRILKKGNDNKQQTFVALLTDEELASLRSNSMFDMNVATEPSFFDKLKRVITIKHRLIKAIQQIENSVEKLKNSQSSTTLPKNADDINTQKNTDKDNNISTELLENGQCNANANVGASENAETSGDSLWTKLMQTILRTKPTTRSRKFDEKLLVERTRASLRKYANIPQNYSVFTCPAPAFMDRFAYRDFYP